MARKTERAQKKKAPHHPTKPGKHETPPPLGAPGFAQPVYTPDPTKFITPHPSDNAAYQLIDTLTKEHKIRPLAFPAARGGVEPVLTLAETLGSRRRLGRGGDYGFRADRVPFRRRYRQHRQHRSARRSVRQDGFGLRRSAGARRAAVLFPPRRRDLQLRRSGLLLRPVLRPLPQLSEADPGAGRQSRRHGRAELGRCFACGVPR